MNLTKLYVNHLINLIIFKFFYMMLKAVKLSATLKMEIGRKHHEDGISSTILAQQYRIHDSTARKYGIMYSKGKEYHNKVGRPSILDSSKEKELVEFLKVKRISKTNLELKDKINSLVDETCEIRGVRRKNEALCKMTVNRLEKKLNIKSHAAEVGTAARIEACNDIRSMASFAAMNKYVAEVTSEKGVGCGHRIFNSDGSAFTVGYKMKDSVEVKCIDGKPVDGKSYKAAPEKNKSGGIIYQI